MAMPLPPMQVTRAVIQRYARILHRYQDDLGERPLVLPNGDFFPDTFEGTEASVNQLVRRMQAHAGLDDIPIQVRVVDPSAPPPAQSNCSSGACGVPLSAGSKLERLVDLGDSWLLHVPRSELRHSVALTTNLSRSLAFVFLVETQHEGELLEPPVDVTADLVAVALGFGPLMLQGSYIYAKSCGGPQVASVTKLGVTELGVAVALFARLAHHSIQPALRELEVTQKAILAEAHRVLGGNEWLLRRIQEDPLRLSKESFELSEPRSLLSRLFGRRSTPTHDGPQGLSDLEMDEVESLLIDMPPASSAGRSSRPPSRVDDELKRLVADSLNRAGA